MEWAAQSSQEAAAQQAAENAAARAAAEREAQEALADELAAYGPTAENGEEWEWVWEEEGGYEYAAYHQHGENSRQKPHLEPAVLYQPLGEPSTESSVHAQPEHNGAYHNASGDGCGDGGYCGGYWVRRSEGGHRHGEPIGGNPWEPLVAWCWLFPNPICGAAEKIEATKH
jgi:hypothetical protein